MEDSVWVSGTLAQDLLMLVSELQNAGWTMANSVSGRQ
jgi:hypothetical protein